MASARESRWQQTGPAQYPWQRPSQPAGAHRRAEATGGAHQAQAASIMAARAQGGSPEISRAWLRNAMTALAVLAGAAAVVRWDAQYVMVRQARRTLVIAALEAGIPDAGALIFAALGIALALHGRRALRSGP